MNDYAVGCVPIRMREGMPEVLLVHSHHGDWTLPKGHPNEGESREQTARRELAEETGVMECELSPEPLFVSEYDYEKDGETVHKKVDFFLATVPPTESVAIDYGEITDWRWMLLADAQEFATHEQTREVLRQAASHVAVV